MKVHKVLKLLEQLTGPDILDDFRKQQLSNDSYTYYE